MANDLSRQSDVLLAELCCSTTSLLSSTCHQLFGQHSAIRMSDWNGCDMSTSEGTKFACHMLSRCKPVVLWVSSECGPYSPLQNINQRTEQQREQLHVKRERESDRDMYRNCMTVARKAHSLGIAVVWEWSQRCMAWSLPEYLAFAEELKMHTGVCNGCQVNLRNSEGLLLRKAWGIDSTWAELARHINLKCAGNHKRGQCISGVYHTAYYTPEFAKRVSTNHPTGHFGSVGLCGRRRCGS